MRMSALAELSHMNKLVALHAKHDENIANLDVAKTSLSNVSHELAKAKHELELVKDAPIVSDVLECDECPIFKSDLASLQSKFATVVCELEELRSRPALLGAGLGSKTQCAEESPRHANCCHSPGCPEEEGCSSPSAG